MMMMMMMIMMMMMMMMMIIIIIIILDDRPGVLTNTEFDHFLIQLMAFDVDSVMVIEGNSFDGR